MSKVLIIGGGGFVGSHLVDKFLSKGYEVTMMDIGKHLPESLYFLKDNKKLTYISENILNKEALNSIVNPDYELVLNLASMVGVKNYVEDPLRTIDVNVIGTRNLLEIAMKKDVKILFTSTSEYFGKNPDVPWDEDADRVVGSSNIDRWTYSTSKALCEHMLFACHKKYGVPVVITRYFNVYGARQRPIFVVSAMLRNVIMGENPLVFDDGKQTRSFTYIDDAAEGTFLAATKKVAEGNAFNIGSQFEMTMNKLGELIIKTAGKEGELTLDHIEGTDVYSSYEDLRRRVPGVDKARRLLGWEATTTPEKGIRKAYQWYVNNLDFLHNK